MPPEKTKVEQAIDALRAEIEQLREEVRQRTHSEASATGGLDATGSAATGGSSATGHPGATGGPSATSNPGATGSSSASGGYGASNGSTGSVGTGASGTGGAGTGTTTDRCCEEVRVEIQRLGCELRDWRDRLERERWIADLQRQIERLQDDVQRWSQRSGHVDGCCGGASAAPPYP